MDDLAAFLRAATPAYERVADVRMDPPAPLPGTSPARRAWLLSLRFTIVPAEDLLAPATGPEARAFQAALGELDARRAGPRLTAAPPTRAFTPP